ncbi:MAG: MlaD family protein [Gemmatimonadota bacterium]
MDSKRPATWRDVVPGIAVLAALILLAAGIFWLDRLRRALLEGPTLVVSAEEIGGLVTGADVWVAGKPAGRVQSIDFVGSGTTDPGLVALRVVLRREAAPMVRDDAEARIGRSSLLSPPVIKLRPGSPSAAPYDFGDTLVVTRGPDIDTFRAFADSGRAALAELTAERARLTAVLAGGSGTLPSLRRDPRVHRRLGAALPRLAIVGEQWAARGGFRRLAGDSVTLERLSRLSASMATISERADVSSTALDPVAKAVGRLALRIERLDEHLLAARGTTGRLLHDGELQLQSERARAQLDSLRLELAARPFRWLRFRLF